MATPGEKSSSFNLPQLAILLAIAAAGLVTYYQVDKKMSSIEKNVEAIVSHVGALGEAQKPENIRKALQRADEDARAAESAKLTQNFLAGVGDIVSAHPFVVANPNAEGPVVYAVIDVSCAYCRAGHHQIAAMAEKGVKVVTIPVGMLSENSKSAAIALLALGRISKEAAADALEEFLKIPNISGETVARALVDVMQRHGVQMEAYGVSAAVATQEYDEIWKFVASTGLRGVPFYATSAGKGVFGAVPDIAANLGL